jgi:hypothetical protein
MTMNKSSSNLKGSVYKVWGFIPQAEVKTQTS